MTTPHLDMENDLPDSSSEGMACAISPSTYTMVFQSPPEAHKAMLLWLDLVRKEIQADDLERYLSTDQGPVRRRLPNDSWMYAMAREIADEYMTSTKQGEVHPTLRGVPHVSVMRDPWAPLSHTRPVVRYVTTGPRTATRKRITPPNITSAKALRRSR